MAEFRKPAPICHADLKFLEYYNGSCPRALERARVNSYHWPVHTMPSAKRQEGTISRSACFVIHIDQRILLPIELHKISIRAFSFPDGIHVFIRSTKIHTNLSNQITFTASDKIIVKVTSLTYSSQTGRGFLVPLQNRICLEIP